MLAALVAALEDPTIDAALVAAGAQLVSWFRSLSEADQQKYDAQVTALMQSTKGSVADANADLQSTIEQLAQLRAQHEAQAQAVAQLQAAQAQQPAQLVQLAKTVEQLNAEHAAMLKQLNAPKNMGTLQGTIDSIRDQLAAIVAPLAAKPIVTT